MALVIAVLLLLTCLALVFFEVRNSDFISAYRSASTCTSPADALSSKACRFQDQALVVSTNAQAGHQFAVSFDSLPGRTFSTDFPTGGGPNLPLSAGDTTTAELWSGKLTRLAGSQTNDDPETYPTSVLLSSRRTSPSSA